MNVSYQWSTDKLLPNDDHAYGTSGPPALAVFNNKLYCIREGRGNSGWLWCATFDGSTWSTDKLLPNDDHAYGTSGPPALAVFNNKLYCIREGRGNSGWLWCAYTQISILDVWGEGRIVTNERIVTGFNGAANINYWKQKISNGPDKGKDIPNLFPVYEYDNPVFPVNDDSVSYITLMGAPITVGTVKEMIRVLRKGSGVIMLYDPSTTDRNTFEQNMGNLIYKPNDLLNSPFDQPTIRPVYIYGYPVRSPIL